MTDTPAHSAGKRKSTFTVAGLALWLALAATPFTLCALPAEAMLDDLKPGHPRLLWHGDEGAAGAAAGDPVAAAVRDGVIRLAESILEEPPVEHVLEGRRLLAVSRRANTRLLALAAAWRLTGDERFLRRAEAEMMAVAAFPDWNPGHFLDVAEMTAGVGLAYDWLFHALPDDSRHAIRKAIVEKGLLPSFDDDEVLTEWTNNWNPVCNAGMVVGALAVADEEPVLAARVVERAVQHVPKAMEVYGPDGVYPEGPMYWRYGSSHVALLVAALESALGTSFGLADAPGFAESADFMRQAAGPSGQVYNFSDSSVDTRVDPALYWMAARFGKPWLTAWQDRLLLEALDSKGEQAFAKRFGPLLLLWRQPAEGQGADEPPPLAWHGDGPVPVAFLRSGWEPEALYLGTKGGSTGVSHAHMDAGSFVLDWGGLRWVVDPEHRSYHSFESAGINLWNTSQDSGRWKIFENGPFSHATLTFDGRLHRTDAFTAITDFSAGERTVRLDLSAALGLGEGSVIRSFRLLPGPRLEVRDELRGLAPETQVRWAITTPAAAEPGDGVVALACDGKRLDIVLTAEPAARIRVEELEKSDPPWQVPLPGLRTVVAEMIAPPEGEVSVTATFTPTGSAGDF